MFIDVRYFVVTYQDKRIKNVQSIKLHQCTNHQIIRSANLHYIIHHNLSTVVSSWSFSRARNHPIVVRRTTCTVNKGPDRVDEIGVVQSKYCVETLHSDTKQTLQNRVKDRHTLTVPFLSLCSWQSNAFKLKHSMVKNCLLTRLNLGVIFVK